MMKLDTAALHICCLMGSVILLFDAREGKTDRQARLEIYNHWGTIASMWPSDIFRCHNDMESKQAEPLPSLFAF
jgi:hypothetical protein